MSPGSTRFLVALLVACTVSALSQSPPFDVDAYRTFLAAHQTMTVEQLLALHPAGVFAHKAPTSLATAEYANTIVGQYELTAYEQSLIERHGFMVSERLTANSFGHALLDIYHKDLPVFVSTDALLHAWHMSYDAILKDVETGLLIGRLDTLLASLHGQVPALAASYTGTAGMETMLRDVDLYLTVPRKLLGGEVAPFFAENMGPLSQILGYIDAEQPVGLPLFQSKGRIIDFSQFTPRGHYTESVELTRYFQAMIWLGRTEMSIIPPIQDAPMPPESDFQRQAIDAVLLHEAALRSDGYRKLNEIDRIIRFFVGESDNITLPQIQAMVGETGLADASALLDTLTFRAFRDHLEQQSYAFQRINSQILWSDPMSPEQIRPAGAFLLLGQRFVIDSYVTGSVVYDKIMHEGEKVRRMLPSTLDILYALGNDAAGQLLVPELERYHYGSNLAALRYLVDSYEQEFWAGTLYNGWLRGIRTLNPPSVRDGLPSFMQTAAWWQEKMNTQLASWSQLRHDNLLYAKQSYSGGFICSFPETFVEPVPEFYGALHDLADSAVAAFRSPMLAGFRYAEFIAGYFEQMLGIFDTLAAVARKEIAGTPFTSAERDFLRHVIYDVNMGCGSAFLGWYPKLFYDLGMESFLEDDRVVADVHTAPTDEHSSPVGWVLHGGTGPVNLAVVVTEPPDGCSMAFIGPVLSYYEHVSTNFKRLTDEEWKTVYAQSPSFRPALVNLYLADAQGQSRGDGPSLLTGINDNPASELLPMQATLAQNFPNPFNGQTVIAFAIPPSLSGSPAEMVVYDLQGRRVRTLLNQPMPAGTYLTRWNGDSEAGAQVASGVYFYHLRVGAQLRTGKMALVR